MFLKCKQLNVVEREKKIIKIKVYFQSDFLNIHFLPFFDEYRNLNSFIVHWPQWPMAKKNGVEIEWIAIKKKLMFIKIHYLNGWKRPLESELNFGIITTRVQWAHVSKTKRKGPTEHWSWKMNREWMREHYENKTNWPHWMIQIVFFFHSIHAIFWRFQLVSKYIWKKITAFILIVYQNGIFVFPKNWLTSGRYYYFSLFILHFHGFYIIYIFNRLRALMQLNVSSLSFPFLDGFSSQFFFCRMKNRCVAMQWYNEIG